MDASAAPPATPEPQDWSGFRRGERITLRHPGGAHLCGVLETSTEDSSVLWIQLDDGGGRRLVHCADGYELRRD